LNRRRFLLLLAGAGAVAAGFGLVRFWRGRDERQIRRRVARLCELFAKTGGESELISLARASEIAQSLAEGFRIELGAPFREHIADRDQLRIAIHQVRSHADHIAVAILDHTIVIDEGGARAESELAVRVRADAGGEADSEMRRFNLAWMKEDRTWRISAVRPADTIEGPR